MNSTNANRVRDSRRGPRWVIARNAHKIRDLRASGQGWAEIARILGEENSVRINKETLARAMKPFSSADPRPSIVVAMENEVERLDQVLAFADRVQRLMDRKPALANSNLRPPSASLPISAHATPSPPALATADDSLVTEEDCREKARRDLGPPTLSID